MSEMIRDIETRLFNFIDEIRDVENHPGFHDAVFYIHDHTGETVQLTSDEMIANNLVDLLMQFELDQELKYEFGDSNGERWVDIDLDDLDPHESVHSSPTVNYLFQPEPDPSEGSRATMTVRLDLQLDDSRSTYAELMDTEAIESKEIFDRLPGDVSVADVSVESLRSDSLREAHRAVQKFTNPDQRANLSDPQRAQLLNHIDEWWVENNWNKTISNLDPRADRGNWIRHLINKNDEQLMRMWYESTAGNKAWMFGKRSHAMNMGDALARVLSPVSHHPFCSLEDPEQSLKSDEVILPEEMLKYDSIQSTPDEPSSEPIYENDEKVGTRKTYSISMNLDPDRWEDIHDVDSILKTVCPMDDSARTVEYEYKTSTTESNENRMKENSNALLQSGELTGTVTIQWTEKNTQNKQSTNEDSGLELS